MQDGHKTVPGPNLISFWSHLGGLGIILDVLGASFLDTRNSMISWGYPGEAQAETIRSGEGERLIGGPTNLHPVWPKESKGYRIQHKDIGLKDTLTEDAG